MRPRNNLKAGEVVIVKDIVTPRNRWKLARIVETYPENNGLVRKVALAYRTLDNQGRRKRRISCLDRPVQKLVLLLSRDEYEDRGILEEEPFTCEVRIIVMSYKLATLLTSIINDKFYFK